MDNFVLKIMEINAMQLHGLCAVQVIMLSQLNHYYVLQEIGALAIKIKGRYAHIQQMDHAD
jgi:hypothetical protein